MTVLQAIAALNTHRAQQAFSVHPHTPTPMCTPAVIFVDQGSPPRNGSVRSALLRPAWRHALHSELRGLLNTGAVEYIRRANIPADAKILRSGVTYANKTASTGQVVRNKARIHVQGQQAREGVDFEPEHVSSPVVDRYTLRVALALATQYDLTAFAIDFEQAYLNAPLQEQHLYMTGLAGLTAKDEQGHDILLKIRKSLFGLPQSAYN